MLKRLFVLVIPLVSFACASAFAQDTSMPPTFTVFGKELELKENKGTSPESGFLAEYIPANETFENWTTMFAHRFEPGTTVSANDRAQALAAQIQKRKAEGDPVANAAVFASKDDGSVAVDFLISDPTTGLYEHNIFRYFEKSKGIASYQFARRHYRGKGDSAKFIKEIPSLRAGLLKELARADLPLTKFAGDVKATGKVGRGAVQ